LKIKTNGSIFTPNRGFLIMRHDYTSELSYYTHGELLPLSVFYVDGDHPDKLFHDHKFVEIVIITRGKLIHIADNECCEIKKGDVLLIHPGVIHAYDHAAGAGVLNLIFDSNKLPIPQLDSGEFPLFSQFFPKEKRAETGAEPLINLNDEVLTQVISLITRIDDEIKSSRPGAMFYSLALFMEVLTMISRTDSLQTPAERPRFLVGDALRYMNKHFFEEVTLSKLARISCMSERSFQRHFHQALGCSPMEHLLKIRLRHVQEQLITSDAEIGEIALNCGFYDSNYLCKKFKAVFGITPSQFRQKKQQPNKK
jgi:AraC-like DNA-binding protein